jgi:hypothetical protein
VCYQIAEVVSHIWHKIRLRDISSFMIWYHLLLALVFLDVCHVDSAIASAGPTIYGPKVELVLSWGYVRDKALLFPDLTRTHIVV